MDPAHNPIDHVMELNVFLTQTVSFIYMFWLNQTNSCHNPTEFRLIMPACLTGLSEACEFVML